MKIAFRLVMASVFFVGTTSQMRAQAPAVAHNTWTSGAPMPTALAFSTAAVLKNEIYVVGGNNGTANVADVQIYNPVTNTWRTGASYPTGIGAASSAVAKNLLYVFGGTSDGTSPSNAVWAYNPKTKAWTPAAAMPTARWAAVAVVQKKTNIIYLIGGDVNASGNGNIATVESYNPATNTWTEEASMLVAKGQSAAGLIGTKIVVADGATNGQGTTGDTEAYDPATNTWKTLASDPASRYASCQGSIGTKLFDMGGQTAPTYSDDFQLSKNKWTTTAPVPQSVMFPASAVFKGHLYCIGGWSANGGPIISNVQIYQP